MITLKDFIDFTYSLKEMEEVKTKNFPVPKEILFKLKEKHHLELQKEIFKQKEIDFSKFVHTPEFEMEVYGITLKFVID